MKKTAISFALLLISIGYNAQVGVNTEVPLATLDVKEKRTAGVNDISAKDGVMIPKLTKTELASKTATAYTAAQNGTIIYVSDATGGTTGTSVSQVTNINATGFYYLDAAVWKKLDTDTDTTTNLYNTNGSLSGNRVVTQGANTLAFTASAVNAFSVDGTTLSVDAANDRLGVGTAAPTSKLHVVGDAKITSLPVSTASSTPVYWDSTTGQVQSYPAGKKPFNTVKYTVNTSPAQDYISNFNTNIDHTKYTIIITSARFSPITGNNKGVTLTSGNDAVPVSTVYTFKNATSWSIHADYPDSNPSPSTSNTLGQYKWEFDVLIVDNNMVKPLIDITVAAPAGSTMSAPTPTDL